MIFYQCTACRYRKEGKCSLLKINHQRTECDKFVSRLRDREIVKEVLEARIAESIISLIQSDRLTPLETVEVLLRHARQVAEYLQWSKEKGVAVSELVKYEDDEGNEFRVIEENDMEAKKAMDIILAKAEEILNQLEEWENSNG